jgi:hypothetical protein
MRDGLSAGIEAVWGTHQSAGGWDFLADGRVFAAPGGSFRTYDHLVLIFSINLNLPHQSKRRSC